MIAVRSDQPSIVPRFRWYHRWATCDVEWMGLAVDKPRYVGYVTRRGARKSSARARGLGIRMAIVPARDVRRRWHLGRHRSYEWRNAGGKRSNGGRRPESADGSTDG